MVRGQTRNDPLWGHRPEALRVILVAPTKSDAVFTERLLRQRVELTTAYSCPEALARVDRRAFDVCLFDVRLGETSMLRFLRTLRAWGSQVPVILLAGHDDEGITVQGLTQGARDYLLRGSLTLENLFRAFRYASGRVKTERALREASRRYRSLFDRSLAGSFRLSLDGHLLDCNDRFLEILGYASKDEALSQPALRLDGVSAEAPTDWVLDLSVSRRRHVDLRAADGEAVPATVDAFLVEGDAGEPQAIEGTILERPAAGAEEEGRAGEREGESAASDRLERLGRLAGGVVHDLNNHLTAILGYANLLMAELQGGSRPRGRAEEVRKAVLRARSLIDDVLGGELDGERRRPGPMHLVELAPLFDKLRPRLDAAVGGEIDLDLAVGEDLPLVRLAPWELERVVTNLVLNGRDAMPEGGRLRVAVDRVRLDGGETAGEAPDSLGVGTYAVFTVADEGVGMDEETRERIFEPFFTTKSSEGTGLGLVSVSDLVRRNRGAIDVDSARGRGTEVSVWLPAVDRAASAS